MPQIRSPKTMIYKLLGDFVILLHFFWILFILFGFLVALKYPGVSFIHLAGLAFTLVLNLGGWYCPLTYVENYVHDLYDPQLAYGGSFITNNLQKLIYLELEEVYLRIGAIVWVGLNVGGYALLLRKRTRRHGAKGKAHSA
jgi:ABC-type multidrug transport system permease subunit